MRLVAVVSFVQQGLVRHEFHDPAKPDATPSEVRTTVWVTDTGRLIDPATNAPMPVPLDHWRDKALQHNRRILMERGML